VLCSDSSPSYLLVVVGDLLGESADDSLYLLDLTPDVADLLLELHLLRVRLRVRGGGRLQLLVRLLYVFLKWSKIA